MTARPIGPNSPVRNTALFKAMEPLLFDEQEMGGVTLADVIEAYYDCRKRKRSTTNCMEFELDMEANCIDL